jgi:hypothetical protein
VTACTVTESSGSASLDSTTCRLLQERALFTPARDSRGEPVSDTVVSRVSWRLPESGNESTQLPPAAEAAMQLWSACAAGEAAKLALSFPLPPQQVADRALTACTTFEALASRELTKAFKDEATKGLSAFKQVISTGTAQMVEKARAALKGVEEK